MPQRTRRAALKVLLALALIAAGPLAAPRPAEAAKKLTLLLNWLPGGAHVPIFYARDAGFYRKAGLEVDIRSARGSRAALKRMHNGEAQFALTEAAELFAHRAGGFDTLGVMVYFSRSPSAILTLKRGDIRRLADLANKRIAAPRASFPRVAFPELGRGAKIDLARLRWHSLTPDELLPALIEGRVDAVAASTLVAFQYRQAARARGKDVAVFPYAEAGVNPYSLILVSMDSVQAKDPELVKAFVGATAEALAAAVERPREALQVFLKGNPALGPDRVGAEWRAALGLIYPPEARQAGLGHFDENRLKQMNTLLGRIRSLRLESPLAALYTNAHVPALKPRPGTL